MISLEKLKEKWERVCKGKETIFTDEELNELEDNVDTFENLDGNESNHRYNNFATKISPYQIGSRNQYLGFLKKKNYEVVYRIDVDANTPKEAALQVEEILKNMIYRPCFEVIDTDTKKMTNIDLNDELVKE